MAQQEQKDMELFGRMARQQQKNMGSFKRFDLLYYYYFYVILQNVLSNTTKNAQIKSFTLRKSVPFHKRKFHSNSLTVQLTQKNEKKKWVASCHCHLGIK